MDARLETLITSRVVERQIPASVRFVQAIGARELAIRPNLKTSRRPKCLAPGGWGLSGRAHDYARALTRLRETATNGIPILFATLAGHGRHTRHPRRFVLDGSATRLLAGLPTSGTCSTCRLWPESVGPSVDAPRAGH